MKCAENIQVEEIKTCLLCGAEGVPYYKEMYDRLFHAPGIWSHLRCPQHGLVWLSPRPVIKDIMKVYTTYYTHNLANYQRSVLATLKNKVESSLLKSKFGYGTFLEGSRFGRFLSLFLPMAEEIAGSSVMWLHAHPKGKLMDVGCGNGSFLAMMQKLGWDVYGVEPDKNSAAIARERLRGPIAICRLEEADLSDDTFDAVTAHHVIEHIHDPIAFLRASLRILKPGGRLVVTTPNIASLGHRVFRKSWLAREAPRHLYLYSPEVLKACVEQMGYQVEAIRTSARSAWEIWCASRLIQRVGKIPVSFPHSLSQAQRFEGLAFQLFEHLVLPLKVNMGEAIVLIASKSQRK